MYELFLTSTIEHDEIESACAILSGYCGMTPWSGVTRVVYFQGPSQPAGISNQTSLEKPLRKDTGYLWKELHQNLGRQSYIIQARYDVSKEKDMGPNAVDFDLDAASATLRWTDFPDPPHGSPLLMQRKIVEIWDQKRLPSILQDNKYQFKAETVEEVYRFFRDGVEFQLSRQFFVAPIGEYSPLASRVQSFSPLDKLPAWESLTPCDKQGRWILQVKSYVLQDNKPDEIKKVHDQLHALRGELDGVFTFKALDRRVHDTRVALHQQGIQALPQRIMLGKG